MSDSESQPMTATKYRYAVVWFESEKTTELVPLSWVYTEEGQDFCYYPPQKDYKHMDAWLASCIEPKANWKSFMAEILSQTKSLEKGKQRLERSYKTKYVESTDVEVSTQKKPVVLSEKSIKNLLKVVPSMPSSTPTLQSASHNVVGSRTDEMMEENNNNSTDPVATNQISRQRTRENNVLSGITAEQMDEKLRQLEISIQSSITSMKRSLLYDLDKKTNEIKNALLANIHQSKVPVPNCSEARIGLGIALPINNLEDFIAFDEALKENEEKKTALMSLYRYLVCGESSAKHCIAKIMTATISKSVETHYSGTGRIMKNVGKKNFSATAVYICLKDTLLEKFGDTDELNNLQGKVGRWLSGAADRNGGRANRKKGDVDDKNVSNTASQ